MGGTLVSSVPESAARFAGPGGRTGVPLSPGALAVLRWLPTAAPSGAFAGQHDRVHCPPQDVHARVSLWWSPGPVHPGDTVGPPRGGLAPGRTPSYSVALPCGGYLWVQDGVLRGWQARAMANQQVLRADGERFEAGRYSAVRPYFRRHYRSMTESAIRAALAEAGHAPVGQQQVSEVVTGILGAEDPTVCGCSGSTPTSAAMPMAWAVPSELLAQTGVERVLFGSGDAAEAAETLWRLADDLWDPLRVGRAMAAETAAKQAGEPADTWLRTPLTEQVVAHVAAQAVRYHGHEVVRLMPAWLLGWVMVARPVLDGFGTTERQIVRALEVADRVRLARVETQWHAMAAARLLLTRSATELDELDDPAAGVWVTLTDGGVDLRADSDLRPDHRMDAVGGMPLRFAVDRAYRCDVRSWLAALSDVDG
jgi:hypothetical protein